MTLSELLCKVSFDELIPTLKGVSAVRDIFITCRKLKRAILRVSEYADMKSGDIILKVVHSKDDGVASRKQVHRKVGESRTNKRRSKKWLIR